MKVVGIIVTCNRKPLLSKLLESLMCQTRKLDGIIVVDNGSEDRTSNFIQTHFPWVTLLHLNQNIGLFGGLEIGIKTGMSQGYDAFLLVDDDAWLRQDAIEQLLHTIDSDKLLEKSIIYCANVAPSGQCFTEPVTIFMNGKMKTFLEFVPELKDKIYETSYGPNIGVYIPRCIIECVGLPRQEMVFCGEEEFIYRVKKAGFKVFRCFSSIVYHKQHNFFKIKVLGKTFFVALVKPWHTYYEIRNWIYVSRKYKNQTLLRVLFFSMGYFFIKIYASNEKLAAARYILNGIYDGLFGRLGMRVHIERPIYHEQK